MFYCVMNVIFNLPIYDKKSFIVGYFEFAEFERK